MTANILPFDFETNPLRVTIIDDSPWFVAMDVCNALQIKNSRDALARLDPDEKGVALTDTLGGRQEVATVNESGLYYLIMRCRNASKLGTPQHRFRKWVTSEVLPAIRKHGQYQDSDCRMGTLIGETIGTDGHQLLGAVIKTKVAALPKEVRRKATTKLWSQIHTAFQVRTAADIPADQLDSARNFIAAYALDGEFLPKVKGEEAIISLDIYDAHNLYRLLSRIVSLNKYRERIGTIAKATDSMPLKDLYSQLQESQLTYRQLDKKLGAHLLQAHRALGCSG